MPWPKGRPRSAETKAKVSRSLIGNQRRLGLRHSEATKARMAEVSRGRMHSATTRQKIADAKRGRPRPDLVGNRLSVGRVLTVEQRQRIGAAQVGRRHTAATRERLSAVLTGRTFTDSTKDQMSASAARRVMREAGAVEFLDRHGRLWRFRSEWERRFAERLDRDGLSWRYQPDCLLLSTGRRYIPDFWVEEWRSYVEVKGRRDVRYAAKATQAIADGHPVLVLIREAVTTFEYMTQGRN
jgi:hypothetical protein